MPQWDESTQIIQLPVVPGQERTVAYLIVLAGRQVGEMFRLQEEETSLGRGQGVNIQLLDDGVSRRHARIVRHPQGQMLEDLGSTNGTFANGQRVTTRLLHDGDKLQIGSTTILKFTYSDRLEETFQRQMYESALRDPLTRIFNRKYLLDRLESEVSFAKRHHAPLSLLLLDLDHFKRINDDHGHLAGDQVLFEFARRISESMRTEDVFARYGGEEFAIVARGNDLLQAQQMAERIRQTVAGMAVRYDGNDMRVTVSVGVAGLPDPDIPGTQELLGAADEALYAAKALGRNTVVVRRPREAPLPVSEGVDAQAPATTEGRAPTQPSAGPAPASPTLSPSAAAGTGTAPASARLFDAPTYKLPPGKLP